MIRNALTGEPKDKPKTLVQQNSDFTAEGAPPPGPKPSPDALSVEPKAPTTPAAAPSR